MERSFKRIPHLESSKRPYGMLTTWSCANSSFCKETFIRLRQCIIFACLENNKLLNPGDHNFLTCIRENRKHSVLSLSKPSSLEVPKLLQLMLDGKSCVG
uniref:Uncharacterized protein n=1 Tax=Opuntia streptacantha TaxID=393608 RepID=A0A7C9ESH4_OPUST